MVVSGMFKMAVIRQMHPLVSVYGQTVRIRAEVDEASAA